MSEKQIKTKKKEKSEKKTTSKPVKSKREMTDKLVKIDQNLIASKKCALTKTSLIFDESITTDEFVNVGRCLKLMKKTILWWIGDWGLFAELNEDFWFSSALEEVRESYSDGTIENAVWICKKIEPSRRREKLSFGHHQVVAPLEPEEQDKYLEEAEKYRLSVMKLRKRIKHDKISAESKEYAQAAIVIDDSCGSFFYLKYIGKCAQAMSKAEHMVDVLRSWRDQYSFDFYSDNNDEVEALLKKANGLLKSLKDLLDRRINDDEDDKEEPKDEPKIEEVKKESLQG